MNGKKEGDGKVTGRAFLLGLIVVVVFAWFTVLRENRPPWAALTATNIPVLPYVLLAAAVLIINPAVRLLRVIRPFSRVELLVIFLMGMVSNGIVSYGLHSQLVPLVAGPSSRFNHPGVKWDVYVEPYLNESFFIEGKGSGAAAIKLRDADEAWNQAKSVLKSAQDVKVCKEDLVREQAALDALGPAQGPAAAADSVRQGFERKLRIAQRQLAQAEGVWAGYAAAYNPEEVLATFDARILKLEESRRLCKEQLVALKKPAVDFVSEFEKGFAPEKRAIPGIVYLPGEGWASYASRFDRLIQGRRALRDLRQADALLAAAAARGERPDAAALGTALDAAARRLEVIGDRSGILAQKAAITARKDEFERIRLGEMKTLQELQSKGWYARASDIEAIEKRVKELQKTVARLDLRIARLGEDIKAQIDPQLAIRDRVLAALEAVRAIQASATTDPAALRRQLQPAMAAFNAFDGSLRRYLAGDIAWGVWARPLLNWSLIILTLYVVLMSLNVLIFRQWAHNEKLIYPLAELPLLIVGGDDPDGVGYQPPAIKSGLFWVGFAISAAVLGWNHLAEAKLIQNISPIGLDFKWSAYVDGSVFNALSETRFKIIFSVVGLSFLVPARVSYSLWLWQVLCMLQLLVMVWLGMGQGRNSFPFHFGYLMNYQTAQGGGALIVFASVILWKCRTYLLSAFAPSSVAGLERGEQTELRVSSALFLGGSLALVAMFILRLGVHPFYAVVIYLLLLILTIGLVRGVAEGGILGTQAFFNPFHFIRHVFGMDKAWSSPALMAPLWIFVAMMYVDIKSFIAPAMANAIKIRDDLRIGRLKFHAAVWASILAAMVVGLVVHLMLGYAGGSGKMSGWHYSGGVTDQMGFGFIQRMMEEQPTDVAGARWWLLAGGVIMTLVIVLRQQFSWVLHPIGLVMCINPMMFLFWGSMFIGWCFKTLVSKYGDRETYQRLRYVAIGLIVGELVVAALGWHRYDFW
jgi:hypothetical protein